MRLIEIQAKGREIIMHAKLKKHSAAAVLEQELREEFIDHVAKLKMPVLSMKAQMVLSTRHVKFRRLLP